MDSVLSTGTFVDVQFSGFQSQIEIMMYYVALSDNTEILYINVLCIESLLLYNIFL
jgi:hypothetical protein